MGVPAFSPFVSHFHLFAETQVIMENEFQNMPYFLAKSY